MNLNCGRRARLEFNWFRVTSDWARFQKCPFIWQATFLWWGCWFFVRNTHVMSIKIWTRIWWAICADDKYSFCDDDDRGQCRRRFIRDRILFPRLDCVGVFFLMGLWRGHFGPGNENSDDSPNYIDLVFTIQSTQLRVSLLILH